MIGKTISHFQIIAQLGGGGMGVVYRARDTKLGRDVALKFLPAHLADDPEAKSRFIQEAEAASALDHANICTIHEIGEARTDETGVPQLFIAMAFYDGQTLKYRLQDDSLPVEESIRIARQIAQGLQRAHEHGIVHRDVKPANIMVTDRNEVKILDFGLAKLTGRVDLTQSGSTLGTAAYMSPEQVRGEAVDHRTDIWALGVVMYQMLTGKRPFEGEYQHAISYKILHEEPASLDDLPDGLREVVERCLRKDADLRFQTAAEVAEALDELANGPTGSVTLADDQEKTDQGRRWIAAAVALAIFVAVIFGFMYWPAGPPAASDAMTQPGDGEMSPDRQRLIVLPFANLGAPEDDYFADGITEEITMRLASVNDLAVISRNTAVRYRDSGKSTPEIGAELDVDYVLEGTVRWAHQPDGSSLVRITPQLIRVSDDTHVWADSYEGQVERIFEIQKQVAGRVAEELSLTFSSSEEDQDSAEVPTSNIEAYQAYLKALTWWRSVSINYEEIGEVTTLLERALELDPLYLEASTLLTYIAAFLANRRAGDERARFRELAERSLAKTTALAPGSAEARLARGYYSYYIGADFERARMEFRSALDLEPGLGDAKFALGIIEMRLGHYESSIRLLQEALVNDPMYAFGHYQLSFPYRLLRRYDDVFRERSQAWALDGTPECNLVDVAIQVDGNTSRAARIQREVRQSWRCSTVEWYERDFVGALAYYDTLEVPEDPLGASRFLADRARFNRYADREADEDSDWTALLAVTDSFMVSIDQTEIFGEPEAAYLWYRLLANAALGRRNEALSDLETLRTAFAHDKSISLTLHEAAAEALIMMGMHDEALDVLEQDFAGPGSLMPVDLTTAVYDPVRTDPRFQALVAKYPWP